MLTHVLSALDPFTGSMTYTADEVVHPYVYVFYVSYVVTFFFTPVMRTIATYYNIIDHPDNIRKMHDTPVAYLGGMAVFLGWLAGLALTQFLASHATFPAHVVINFSIIAGACIIVLLGLWDDIFHVRARVKILGQFVAAATLLMSGVGRHAAWVFISPVMGRLSLAFPNMHMIGPDHWIVLWLSSIFVVLIVLGCCNATNLMDGLDGLCGGVTAVVAAGFLFLAIHLAMRSGALNANEDGVRVVLGLALLGAVLGFVPFNFNPASIFMGDTGSMFLGYACALMIILFAEAMPKWFLASMVIFALPIMDTALALCRRWVNKKPLFSADRHHFHHQLVARGYSVKQTVIISYGLAILFAVLGCLIAYVRTRYAVGFYLVIFGSIIVAAYKMGMVHERPRLVTRKTLNAPDAMPDQGVVEPSTVLELMPSARREGAVQAAVPGTWADTE